MKTVLRMLNIEIIAQKIFVFRGHRVMLDRDIAALYGVPTKILNQAVKRNLRRFPQDFMFQMTKEEMANWKSQIVTSNKEKMGIRRRPFAFTEQGVAMLSSVINSERAIDVNIQIVRTFAKIKEILSTNQELAKRLEELENKYGDHDEKIKIIFEAIRQLLEPPPASAKPKIGFYVEKWVPWTIFSELIHSQ